MDIITFLTTNSFLLLLIALWVLPWKGVALWRAARSNQPAWFIALLLVNTIGILEILYIFVFSKMGKKEEKFKPASAEVVK